MVDSSQAEATVGPDGESFGAEGGIPETVNTRIEGECMQHKNLVIVLLAVLLNGDISACRQESLYCAETWTMRQVDIARLEALERISWTEHISNEEVLTLVVEERSLISTIRARQRNWMGHLLRGDSLQREIMEGRMEGKRGRRRPRQNYWTG